jgi:hypothetical protein
MSNADTNPAASKGKRPLILFLIVSFLTLMCALVGVLAYDTVQDAMWHT